MEYETINREASVEENVDFVLNHLTDPLFPRKIMTKALGYQKEVFNKQELLIYFKASNYEDCRINAYPTYTEYKGINLTAPSFIMIDLDLKDFDYMREELNKILYKALDKINNVFHGAHPTVFWTGNGYHIYQPMSGFVLEEIDRFEQFIESNKKDLTTRFMQFAEDYFTDNKGDPQHRPSVKSCLIRIPGTINSKCNHEVKIVQEWNGVKPPINYVLREFRIWLISKIIEDKRKEKLYPKRLQWPNNGLSTHSHTNNAIPWIEKLLHIPITDNRKYVIWRILVPYLFNVRNLPTDEVAIILQSWLDSCSAVRPLDFNSHYLIRQNIRSRDRNHYLPISIHKLSLENYELYKII